jgi:hypothetical protein
VTLREIRAAYPDLFYEQTWFDNEPFYDREAEVIDRLPEFDQWSFPYMAPMHDEQRVSAASLALLYVKNPDWEGWTKYWWCDDMDSQKQRVFVGSNGKGLEIHRYLSITSRFGLPKWA